MGNLKRGLAGFITVFSFLAFIILLPSIFKIEQLSNFDLFVSSNVSKLWSPGLTSFFIAVTQIGNIGLLLPISFVLFIFLIYKNDFYESFILALSTFGGAVSVLFLKELTKIPRLDAGLIHEASFSFPSGHATMTTVFFLTIGYILRDRIKNLPLKMLFEVMCISLVILVGLSRIYLGVHRPTEVAAGFLLGTFCVSISIVVGHKLFKELTQ